MPVFNSKFTAAENHALNARPASLGLAGTAQLMSGFAVIALLHVLTGFTLHGGRVAQLGEIFFSDRLVFGLPTIGVLGMYIALGLYLLPHLKLMKRVTVSLALAVCATTFSFYLFLFCAFNTFGT
jgi:hypothetical protein